MIKSNFNEPAQETYEERLAKLEAKADKIEEMLGHPKNPQPTLQPKEMGHHPRKENTQKKVQL